LPHVVLCAEPPMPSTPASTVVVDSAHSRIGPQHLDCGPRPLQRKSRGCAPPRPMPLSVAPGWSTFLFLTSGLPAPLSGGKARSTRNGGSGDLQSPATVALVDDEMSFHGYKKGWWRFTRQDLEGGSRSSTDWLSHDRLGAGSQRRRRGTTVGSGESSMS
jgi:hypothetical protein